MTYYSPLHAAARLYAQAGWPVFPLQADDGTKDTGKQPATRNGFKDATTDLVQIDAWWTENPHYNIGFCPADAGLTVVDLDGVDGLAAWEELSDFDRPLTWTTKTWSDGRHLFYEGEAASSVRKIVKGRAIDTRGTGGYVVLPPSIVAGKAYEVFSDVDTQPLPQWVSDNLLRSDIKVTGRVENVDEGAAQARGRRLVIDRLQRGDNPILGPGANDRTFKFVAQLRDLGLPQAACFDLLMEELSPPSPWDQALSKVVANAYAFAGNEEGVYAVEPSKETFAHAIAQEASLSPLVSKLGNVEGAQNPFELHDSVHFETIPDPSWLIPGVLPDCATAVLYGQTGSYKSTLALDMALCVASGRPIFGVAPDRTGWVVYATLEGLVPLMKRRKPSWVMRHPEIPDYIPFFGTKAPRINHDDQKLLFLQAIDKKVGELGTKPALIVIDTIAKAMVGLKSDDHGAGLYVDFCDILRDRYGCAVLSIGHTGKDEDRGHAGSQVFANGMDSHLYVKRNKPSHVIELHVLQHKDEDAREEPYYLEAELVGRALVLKDIPRPRSLVSIDDIYNPRRIGAALIECGAQGGSTIDTSTFADLITVVLTEDSPERAAELRKGTERKLRMFAKGKLQVYRTGEGKDLRWGVP